MYNVGSETISIMCSTSAEAMSVFNGK
jgi:hypothetical protein